MAEEEAEDGEGAEEDEEHVGGEGHRARPPHRAVVVNQPAADRAHGPAPGSSRSHRGRGVDEAGPAAGSGGGVRLSLSLSHAQDKYLGLLSWAVGLIRMEAISWEVLFGAWADPLPKFRPAQLAVSEP